MAWIESHQSLADHPKLHKLAATLEISPVTAVGHLHYLWWWAMNYARDGDLTGYTSQQIADIMRWPGDPDALITALLTAGRDGRPGFLERDDRGRLLLHDWFEYAGRIIERREKDAARMRAWRQKQGNIVTRNKHVTNANDELERHANVTREFVVPTNQPVQDDDDLVHRSRSSKSSSEKGVQGEERKTNVTRDEHVTNANDPFAAAVYTTYDENIGRLTSIVSQKIGAAIDEFGAARVLEAIKAAALNGARSWSYVEKVLGNEDSRRGPPKKNIKEHYLGGKLGDLIKH